VKGSQRYKLICSYDGTNFHGWAKQIGLRTVQSTIETALVRLLAPAFVDTNAFFVSTPIATSQLEAKSFVVPIVVGGRTDTGVHAESQVFHLDLIENQQAKLLGRGYSDVNLALMGRLNGLLPSDVRIHDCESISNEFHARYSAIKREYRYCIIDNTGIKSALMYRYAYFFRGIADLDLMNRVSQEFIGTHDFSTFIKNRPGSGNVRNLLEFNWTKNSSGAIRATLIADAFGHNMVRSLVGSMLFVGSNRRTPKWLLSQFNSRQRVGETGPIAAKGLTLHKIYYAD
jgi:tRNA pseudouridine38-40 synthase